jgi:hypothetical protein
MMQAHIWSWSSGLLNHDLSVCDKGSSKRYVSAKTGDADTSANAWLIFSCDCMRAFASSLEARVLKDSDFLSTDSMSGSMRFDMQMS